MCGWIKSVNVIPPLDKWISNNNTNINKRLKKRNLHRFASTQKDHTLSQINMDSTIVGPMNDRN